MGFFSSLLGDDAADAARAAAADTYRKQQAAGADLRAFGDQYAGDFEAAYAPYASTGHAANDAFMRLLQDPSSVRSLPGYQFAMDEGINGLERSAAAKGMLNSGQAGKDVLRYSTGFADQTYGNQMQRLMSGGAYGMRATGGQMQGKQGQLGTRTSSYAGDMNAAGTIGQGDIAAANAKSSALQNLMNFGGNLAGKAIGAGWFK